MNKLNGLHRSHTSLARGYVSRKNGGKSIVVEYHGRFGRGFKVFTPNWDSTRYCYVTYYVEA